MVSFPQVVWYTGTLFHCTNLCHGLFTQIIEDLVKWWGTTIVIDLVILLSLWCFHVQMSQGHSLPRTSANVLIRQALYSVTSPDTMAKYGWNKRIIASWQILAVVFLQRPKGRAQCVNNTILCSWLNKWPWTDLDCVNWLANTRMMFHYLICAVMCHLWGHILPRVECLCDKANI